MDQEPDRPVRVRPETRADKIMWPVAMWSLFLALLGVPCVIIAALFLPSDTVRLVAQCFLAAAVVSDLGSVYLDVTHILRGRGVSGIPLFVVAYYAVFVVFGMRTAWWWRLIAFVGLAILHVACHHYLALPIARLLGWRPPSPNSRGRGGEG